MAIEGLSIIGESINDSVPSTQGIFEANDIDGLLALAKKQDEKGAAFIDVNIGRRTPDFMAEMITKVQSVTTKPLVVDTPDYEIAAAGLKAYDTAKAGGALPVLNSISPLRPELFDLYKEVPFRPILMVSERMEGTSPQPNKTAEETYQTTKSMLKEIRDRGLDIPVSDCIIDTGIAPIGSDCEDQLKRVLDSLKLIHDDPECAGIHASVGLSNFTVMLPPKRPDGMPIKSALESAFLTMAMPLGLDMVIGSVARKYETLPEDHPAMACLRDVIKMGGFDALTRVIEFYS
ncbi:MAG: dihydropteroate synthase [Fibrobacteria bacterium]|nr:dihydropteroate synthase [Fibrobacteria bacterium]